MRVVICWTGVSGYMRACWLALAAKKGIDLRVIAFKPGDDAAAPFHAELIQDPRFTLLSRNEIGDPDVVAKGVLAHRPDVVVVPGWAIASYRALQTHSAFRRVPIVMTMDTPFRSTWRQRVGRLAIGRYVRRMAAVVVAGERSWQYARYLGVPEQRIVRGVYGFDDAMFGPVLAHRLSLPEWPRRFLFVGRYVADKAIDTLMAGYRAYRASVPDPWPLSCCGQGPEGERVRREEGVTDLGFIQPEGQPRLFAEHGVYVMSSRYEPWGVALAEAAASGLPVVCTEACGAGLDIVRSHHNGLTVATDDVPALASALRWAHQRHALLPGMGAASRTLALPFTADRWAERWASRLDDLTGTTAAAPGGAV